MKNIAIEATLVSQKKNPTGLGGYVHNLLKAFSEMHQEDFHFYLLHSTGEWQGENYGENFTPVSYRFTRHQSAAIVFNLNTVLKKINADLFHATCNTGVPPFINMPVLTTVHDIYPIIAKHDVSLKSHLLFKLMFSWTAKNTTLFLCNSQFTMSELGKYGIPKEKLDYAHLAPCMDLREISRNKEITEKYMLCVGAIEKRKGQPILLDAYCQALENKPGLPSLVFIGPDRGGGHYFAEHGNSNGKVRWLNYVDDQTMRQYYANAEIFICPSLYEGFGLPLLEAVSAELPVICSDIPVFHEIARDYPFFVKPDAESFRDALLDIDSCMTKCRTKSIMASEIKAEYSWRRTAEKTLAAYRKLLESSAK